MDRHWFCRDYQEGDEHQILALFREAFGREMSPRVWNWRFRDNPCGSAVIKLLFDKARLIGHYAVIPMPLQVEGEPRRAAFSMTTMTHPGYAGQGIFSYLAEETYKKCWEDGLSLVYGFPNKNSYYGFTHRLGWQGQGKMSVWEKPLQEGATWSTHDGNLTRRLSQFDSSADLLWQNAGGLHTVAVQRRKEFLNWRFVQNPKTTYAVYVAPANSEAILGYVVLKVYQDGPVRRGHIVDILSVDDKDVAQTLLIRSYAYFSADDADLISCWMPDDSLYGRLMREDGFVKKEAGTFFGFRAFNNTDRVRDIPFTEWFLTMADSDVF